MSDNAFVVTNASGRAISLLNENESVSPILTAPSPPSSDLSDESNPTTDRPKRKYHCSEPGCRKSFTTSGHLARHNRIHTGEKNFPCLFPGCQSRFSRQDNMMQHYRTHMSPKSRRMPKKVTMSDEQQLRPRPRLHAHQRIRSDPYHIERPLTIDQHLNNYRQSLMVNPMTPLSKYNMPTPLGTVAASHHSQKLPQQPQLISSSSSSLPSSPTMISSLPSSPNSNSNNNNNSNNSLPLSPPPSFSPLTLIQEEKEDEVVVTKTVNEKPDLFYQHKPLSFHNEKDLNPSDFPFTLLHPPKLKDHESNLYQLAHIVSTFG